MAEDLLTPAQVAVIFKTTPKSITRLSQPTEDRPAVFHPVRTAGGHRRYRASEVETVRRQLGGRPLIRPHRRRAASMALALLLAVPLAPAALAAATPTACHHHAGRHHHVCVQPGGPNIPI